MVGSATFTIVTSMMDMNMAATKTTPTATFWLMRTATASSSPGYKAVPAPEISSPARSCARS
jgi:hypothetical protein